MEPSTSSSGDSGTQPTVFLSHSGKQKVFVERLNDAIQRAQHTTFFDKETLRKGSHFPTDIQRAAHSCKLGVLVLSHNYLSSKWPMLELGWLVSEGTLLLPLFFKITTQELRRTENLSKWKHQWIKMVGLEQAEQWEKAVKKLPSTNGVVYQHQSEISYIEEVVKVICNLIPSNVAYDLSYVQGHQHLSKEIERYFDLPVADRKVCMIGLHGIGGLGKTTLCKSMVNLFTSRYFGRSCLIEFPTEYDEAKVVEVCKKALEKFANQQRNISGVTDFDMVVQLMKTHVSKLNVFLAIDNVWESSVEAAGRLLGIGFTADSKVLLTSRSEAVLRELLSRNSSNSYNWYIGSLPTVTRTVAFQIFQHSLNRGDLTSLPVRDEIDNLLNRCRYNGKYHPLALKALGTHVKRLCGAGESKMDLNGWFRVLGKIRDIDMKDVHNLIKLNYEGLEQHLKHIFLDIARWIPLPFSFEYKHLLERTLANTCRWLYSFYEETLVEAAIFDLAMAGVIQIEKASDGREMIQVHDLYLDLAEKEAVNSSRFLIARKNLVEGIDLGNLERVFLEPHTKMVQLDRCQQIQFLYANGIKPEDRIPVMPKLSLRVLILRWVQEEEEPCTSSQINFHGFMQLQFLFLENCHVESLEGLNSLQNLRVLAILTCFRLKDIEALRYLTQLKMLSIQNCHALKGTLDLGEATGLEKLWLQGCTALKGILDLGEATGLETLWLDVNESLEKVEGRLGPALKQVIVEGCTALKGTLDLGEATGLETLWLQENESLEKVEGRLGPALKEVSVKGCTALKGTLDLGEATGLDWLELDGNESLEKVEGRLGPALKQVSVKGCTALKGTLDLGEATGLETLWLDGNESLEKVEGRLGPALKEVFVRGCTALKGTLDLGEAFGLETLRLDGNESLEKVEGRLGPALKQVIVQGCTNLKGTLDLGEATGLEMLWLQGNESLEKVEGRLGPALKKIAVEGCTALKRFLDLSGATGLLDMWRVRLND